MKTCIATILAGIITAASVQAAVVITSGTYTQNFNSVGSALPAGWGDYTGATGTSLGTAASFTTAATSWSSNTPVGFRNSASTAGLTSSSGASPQANSADRAFGLKLSTGLNSGVAEAFNFSTTDVSVTSFSFDLLMLYETTASSTFSIQYGIGASPTSWTTLGTWTDPGVWGSTSFSYTSASFGTALDNQSSVWFRVVTLSAASNPGSLTYFDTVGLDNFALTAVPEPASIVLFGIGAGMCLMRFRHRQS